jgi:hypothetical protein
MSDIAPTTPAEPKREQRRARSVERPSITLPNGKVLDPRRRFADEIGLAERTVAELKPPTVYIGKVAYVDRDATLMQLAAKLKRRNRAPETQTQRKVKKKRARPCAAPAFVIHSRVANTAQPIEAQCKGIADQAKTHKRSTPSSCLRTGGR